MRAILLLILTLAAVSIGGLARAQEGAASPEPVAPASPEAGADSVGRVVPPAGTSLARPGKPAMAPGDSIAARPDAEADSIRKIFRGPWYRQPRWIMFRSVAVPGWGQWANGKHVKAAVVAAGEGYLIWRAVDYGRQESRKADEARLAAEDPDRQAKLLERKRYYGSRRRDFTWWSVFAAVLSMGDAYVDAQLGPFDPEFLPQDGQGGIGLKSGATLRFGLTVHRP